jgi:rhamnosyltransferase subunit B
MPTSSALGQLDGADSAALDEFGGTRSRRILMMPLGTWGDVIPFVQLGRELRRRGHAVAVVACDVFEPLVRRAGLEFVALLGRDEYERVVSNPRLWHPRWAGITFLREAVLPNMRRQFEIADAAIRAGVCDVLVAPAQSLGARIAQEKYGVPLVTVHLAPYMFRSAIQSRRVSGVSLPDWFPRAWKQTLFRLADFCGDQLDGRVVNAFVAELGLPRAKHVFWEWWNSPARVVALFPEWFAEPQSDWPQQTVLAGFLPIEKADEAPLDGEVESFLYRGPAPVVFTAGTAMAHGGRFFEESLRSVQRLGQRAILLTRFRDQLPTDLPPGVIAHEFVPLSTLLPRVAAIVHHGGIGTTAQALAAGVPQLIVPMSFDQPDNAYRVERCEVGRTVRSENYRVERAAAVLGELLADEPLQRRCRAMAARCAGSDGLRIACDEIEGAAGVVGNSVGDIGKRDVVRRPR